MGLKDLKITYDNPWSTYYPGQTVTGNVVVVLDTVKKLRGRTIEIQTGEHKFPFTCILPSNLPSSFESDYGHVRYTVKATLDRPWKFDQDVKSPFTVISQLDLNREPRAAEAVREEMSKTFGCLCCASQPLTVNFSLPVRGYVPGQSMPIRIMVENRSDVVVNVVKLVLRKIVTFYATSPRADTRRKSITVTEVCRGPVQAGGSVDYVQQLNIPPLPPSDLNNCRIIDLEYKLKVEACPEGWYHRNLSDSTHVFIGTVPLTVYHATSGPSPSAPPAVDTDESHPTKLPQTGFAVPSANNAMPPDSHTYPHLPPPSYEEAVYGTRDLRDEDESEYTYGLNNYFAPRYPVYNFAQGRM